MIVECCYLYIIGVKWKKNGERIRNVYCEYYSLDIEII